MNPPNKIILSSCFWQLLLLLAIHLLIPDRSYALEVYSMIINGCDAETGLIVDADDKSIHMLTLDGNLAELRRNDIEVVLVYNIHDNPVSSLNLASGLYDTLREVEVDDKEGTHFIGWPIRFIENMIVFYDVDGKTHLVDLEKIKAFTYPKDVGFTAKPISNFKPVHFGLGDNLPECRQEDTDLAWHVEPTRMISDRIRVHKFFSVYHTGFMNLKRFQRKTAFYAKPFLYEEETRLGIVYVEDELLHELNFIFPLYLQWSSGKPYGSQGQYVIGSTSVDLLPLVEPQFIFRADGKSHFFTGTFAGNMMCLAGGSDCIIENRQFLAERFSKVDPNSHAVYSQFNYMALTGVEYHEYSVSGGFYYPIYGIWGNGMFREVHSRSSSPIFRLRRTDGNVDVQLVYSQSHLHSDSPSEDEIELILAGEMSNYAMKSKASEQLIDSLSRFDLKARLFRIGINWDITENIRVGISEVYFQGDYSERFSGQDYSLDFLHLKTLLSFKQSFSRYTAIKGELNYSSYMHDYKKGSENGDSDEDNISFAISIEFFL
jgi:hypothetical protein